MFRVLLAAIFFGFVHPGSKLILGQGLDLVFFCLFYIGIRLLAQLPVVLIERKFRITAKQMTPLLLIGVVGAVLQLTEFAGIYKGASVPVVSFLVYTHPLWTLILGSLILGETFGLSLLVRVGLGVAGLIFILLSQLAGQEALSAQLLFPILASFLIAAWVVLSDFAKREGISSITISFYYDLFAFVALLAVSPIITSDGAGVEAIQWLLTPAHLIEMIGYSIFVGLLPNLLFYSGSGRVSALAAGLMLLIEPLVSSALSHFIWKDEFSATFMVGALLVLFSAVPFKEIFDSRRLRKVDWQAAGPIIAGILLLVFAATASANTRTLHLVEIAPQGPADYTLSKELSEIRIASDLAIHDFLARRNNCNVKIQKTLKRGSEDELFSEIRQISHGKRANREMLVGLSRSSFARIGAKAAEGTSLEALSIGASTETLSTINKNFFSIVSPWRAQWSAIRSAMLNHGCKPGNTIGYFDVKDGLSVSFKEAFKGEFGGASVGDAANIQQDLKAVPQCLFLAINFAQAEPSLSLLIHPKSHLNIFGIGDWNYYPGELKAILKQVSKNDWDVVVPTGWTTSATANSKRFAKRIRPLLKSDPAPLGAYAYDSTLIALNALCSDSSLSEALRHVNKSELLREYSTVNENHNFVSRIYTLNFKGTENP